MPARVLLPTDPGPQAGGSSSEPPGAREMFGLITTGWLALPDIAVVPSSRLISLKPVHGLACQREDPS